MARRTTLVGEAPRAARELVAFAAARRGLMRGPRGDGRPVLVLPGFTGSDRSTLALRRLLRGLGYHVHAWRLGRNWGPTDRVLDGLRDRVQALLEEHGQPLTLVGHSLGGIYSREIARAAPEAVRHVITLGSPFRAPGRRTGAVAPLFRALSPFHSERAKDVDPARIVEPIPAPLTAIFTRGDAVVHWRTCTVDPAERTECIEVDGSHSGLVHNPAAISVILDRLTLDGWRPYVETAAGRVRVWRPD